VQSNPATALWRQGGIVIEGGAILGGNCDNDANFEITLNGWSAERNDADSRISKKIRAKLKSV
jgi:hypothetical protein